MENAGATIVGGEGLIATNAPDDEAIAACKALGHSSQAGSPDQASSGRVSPSPQNGRICPSLTSYALPQMISPVPSLKR